MMMHFKRAAARGTHDDPVELLSELDEARFETRKVDVFADGRLQAASKDFGTGDTWLSYEPIPSLDDINSQTEFDAVEITREAFETIWAAALSQIGR